MPVENLYIRTNLENECYKKTFFSELELYFNKENTLIGTNHIQNINIKYLSFYENNEKISIYMNQKTTTKHRPFSFSQDCTSIEYTEDFLIYGGYRAPALIENNSIIYYSGSLIVEDFISRYSQRYYRESKKIEKKRIAKAWNITNVANYQFRSIVDPYKKNHPFAIYENVINQKEYLDLEAAERMTDEMYKTLKIRGLTDTQKKELENYFIQLVLISEEKGSKKYKNYFQRLLIVSYLKIAIVVAFVVTMIVIRLF